MEISTDKHKKARSWFITILNPEEKEIEILLQDNHSYMVYQYEECPTTGTKHIHAVIHYPTPRLWPKKKYARAHIQVVRNMEQCIAYCTKEETRVSGPWELGKRPEQGRRTDLESTTDPAEEREVRLLALKHDMLILEEAEAHSRAMKECLVIMRADIIDYTTKRGMPLEEIEGMLQRIEHKHRSKK